MTRYTHVPSAEPNRTIYGASTRVLKMTEGRTRLSRYGRYAPCVTPEILQTYWGWQGRLWWIRDRGWRWRGWVRGLGRRLRGKRWLRRPGRWFQQTRRRCCGSGSHRTACCLVCHGPGQDSHGIRSTVERAVHHRFLPSVLVFLFSWVALACSRKGGANHIPPNLVVEPRHPS
jgi:hypothetical protein